MHSIVFLKKGEFCGWPANNGIWIWGNEILVGFIQALHKKKRGHTYEKDTARRKFARSLDGGITWSIEDACLHGIRGKAFNHNIPENVAKSPGVCSGGISFANLNFALTFSRENNSTGPSHFYYTGNRGKQWQGPFIFPDLGNRGIAARTDYIVEDDHSMMVFLTACKSDRKEGCVICARTEDGGRSWHEIAQIGPEFEEELSYSIMPSSVCLSDSHMLVIVRTRINNFYGLNVYISRDRGSSWEDIPVPELGNLPGQRGEPIHNPPSLIKLYDGRLCLSYGVRTEPARMCIRFSSDMGLTWGDEIIVRGGDGAEWDMGYPRMVQRPDGMVILIYYYNNAMLGKFPFRYIASTIFDPSSISGNKK